MSEESPFDRERWEAQRAHDASNEFFHKSNAAAIESGNLALKTIITLNGGAILSLLTFIGSNPDKHKGIAAALTYFALGIISAGFSVSAAYLANYFTTSSERTRKKTFVPPYTESTSESEKYIGYRRIALLCAILGAASSLFLFSAGVYRASDALTAEPLNKTPAYIVKMNIGPVRLEVLH